MAKSTDAELFIGVDHQYPFTILNEAETAAIDITGWTLSWMVKRRLSHDDADAVITKTTVAGISIAGTYDADPDTNTQKATVTVEDGDTDGLSAGEYFYELKRTDSGFETILAYGGLTLVRSVHRS